MVAWNLLRSRTKDFVLAMLTQSADSVFALRTFVTKAFDRFPAANRFRNAFVGADVGAPVESKCGHELIFNRR